jgi:aspartate racemase
MHIGLIGGIGPAATIYYYKELVRLFAEAKQKMALTIVHTDLGEYAANMASGNADGQARLFAQLTAKLKTGGCDSVALTSMGGHFCIAEFESLSPLPVLNAIPVLNAEFSRQNLKRIGVLGTRAVMDSGLYGVASAQVIAPPLEERNRVHDTYVAMATLGFSTSEQRIYMQDVAARLHRDAGVDAIVLGGTDLFLAFDQPHYAYKIIDCAIVHAP